MARYAESLDWLQPYWNCFDKVTVYNKGAGEPPGFPHGLQHVFLRQLPNVGREAHTYAWHLWRNHGALCDQLLFTQGAVHDKMPLEAFGRLVRTMRPHMDPLDFGAHETVNGRCGGASGVYSDYGPMAVSGLTFGAFARRFFGVDPPPPGHPVAYFGVFATTAAAVRRHPRAIFATLLADTNLSSDVCPEEAFYLERLWSHVLPPPHAHAHHRKLLPQAGVDHGYANM